MAIINYPLKEITVKIVYYGPGLSGKTTSLKYVYENIPQDKKGKMVTISTEGDRTLFFDFLPVEMGKIGDFTLRLQLYTVPGQVFYENTRVLVLQQTDAVIFVADSQKDMLPSNIESFNSLFRNLKKNNIDPEKIPIVIMYNKRDLNNILPVSELNKELNTKGYPYFETSAITGLNVMEALKLTIKLAVEAIKKRYNIKEKTETDETIFYQPESMGKKSDIENKTIEAEKETRDEEIVELAGDEESGDLIELSMDDDESEIELIDDEGKVESNEEPFDEIKSFPEESDEEVKSEEVKSESLESDTPDFSDLDIGMEAEEVKMEESPESTMMFDKNILDNLEDKKVDDKDEKKERPIDNVFEGVEDIKEEIGLSVSVDDTSPEEEDSSEQKGGVEEVLFSKDIEVELPFTIEKDGKDISLKLRLNIKLIR